jgi:DNA-binding CsgD family transcriptional regulator
MIALAPMERAEGREGPAKGGVLLFAQDQFKGKSYVAALEKATVPVEWVTTASALRSRLSRADLPRPALVMVLPSSRERSMRPSDLASVALRLTADLAADLGSQRTATPLEESLNDYCAARSLSGRQRQVLELYLIGNNDKEIASSFKCSATTVYEHWRRMAKKANGAHKSDVVNDFHRFLATRSEAINPRLRSLFVAPGRSIRRSGP